MQLKLKLRFRKGVRDLLASDKGSFAPRKNERRIERSKINIQQSSMRSYLNHISKTIKG